MEYASVLNHFTPSDWDPASYMFAGYWLGFFLGVLACLAIYLIWKGGD